MTMRDRAPQARGPHEIEDFVGWEKATQWIGRIRGPREARFVGWIGAEDPSDLLGRSSRTA